MQNVKTTETGAVVLFDNVFETVPGGVTVAIADLVQTTLAAGTPIGKDGNNLYHVIKTAEAQANATNSATDYKLVKGHHFAVGDFLSLGEGKKAYAITAIDTSNASYDLVSIGTTLGTAVTAGDYFLEAAAESTSTTSAAPYTCVGLVGEEHDVTSGSNILASCVVRGSVREANLTHPVTSDLKTDIPLIRFV